MASDNRPLVDTVTNADWLNAIRNEAGHDYQQRIPEATQANIQDTVNELWKYRPHLNQFVDSLINRIGLVIFSEWSWSNPLAPLKRGMLEHGETIEEIMVGLVEADEYDASRDELEGELFGSKAPEVQVNYHTVNRKNRYKLTVKEPLLRNAFLTDNGLSTFVAQLLSAAQKSDQFDEYLTMANLFKEMDQAAGGLYNVNVEDIGSPESTGADARYALRRFREFGNTLQFPSRLYNPAGMTQAVRQEDLILFVTPEADAAMDVEALAASFNIDKAEFGARKFVLPIDHFGIPGFQAALTTKEMFVVADQLITTTSQPNAATLAINYWLHHWQVISASRFAPVVMFNSERPSTTIAPTVYAVTGITSFVITDENGVVVTATGANSTVKRGEIYNVAVEATTTPAGGPNVAVTYSIDDHSSVFTRVSNTGVLIVGPDEENTSLTIRATAVHDMDGTPVTATAVRTVGGDRITVWPKPGVTPAPAA